MAVSINAREVALSNTAPRSSQASVGIGANSAVFIKPATGNTTPSSITLVATTQGYSTPTYTWSYALNTSPDTWTAFGSGASTQNITNTAFETTLGTASALIYRCVVTESLRATSTAYYNIDYTKEGVQGTNLVAELTNDYCAVPTDSAGNNGVFTGAETTLEVYLNGVKQTTGFTYYVSALSAVTYRDADDASDQSDTGELNAGISAFPVSIKSLSADAGYIDITAKRTSDSTLLTKRFILAKNKSGTPGVTPAYYYVVASVSVISKASPDAATDGIHTPSSVVFTPYKVVGNAAPVLAIDAFFTLWTSPGSEAATATAVDAASTTTILSTADISAVNYRLYNLANKSVLLDSETVPVVFKGSDGAPGNPGAAGNKSITLTAFKWSTSTQTAPTQAATLTWSGFGVSAYPTGWTSSAPASTTNGETLYQLNVIVTAAGDATNTAFNWSSGTVGRIGYREDGTIGLTGSSARTAYAVTSSGTAPTPIAAGTGDVVPITAGVTWSFTATSVLDPGQYMYQVDGIYNPNTNVTAWGVAYLSNLKVGSLSALAVDTGNLTVSTSGSIKNVGGSYNSSGFFLGYDSTAYKFSVGNGTNNLTFDGTTLSIPAARVTGTLSADRIAAGTITASKIVGSNTDNIIPDPGFSDFTWWGFGTDNNFVSTVQGGISEAPTRYCTINGGMVTGRDYTGSTIPMEVGASYRAKLRVYVAAGTTGNFQPLMHLPNVLWFSPAETNGNGLNVNIIGTIPVDTWTTYTKTFTFQGNTQGNFIHSRVVANITTGNVRFAWEIVRAVDTALVVDGAITADKLVTNFVYTKAINVNNNATVDSSGNAIFKSIKIQDSNGTTVLESGGNLDFGRVGGAGKPSDNANNTSVDVNGNIQGVSAGAGSSVANNRSSIIDAPGGAVYVSSAPGIAGAIRIKLPIQVNVHYTMFKMNVEIYEYIEGLSCTLAISGHTSGTGWYNVTANLIGGNVEYPVRYGHDGTNFVIWIGNTTETWDYPQVFVRNFVAGYSSYQASVWSTGWEITISSAATTNVTKTVTDTYPPADWSKTARRPTTLAGINSTEGSKLGGIESGATVGATWGTNITSQPTNLSGINSAEGGKLSGIAPGATSDLELVVPAGYTQNGNTVTRTTSNGWSPSVYTSNSFTGGASIEVKNTGEHWMAGLNTNPSTSDSYEAVDYVIHESYGNFYGYTSGTNIFGPISNSGGYSSVTYDGTNVYFIVNGNIVHTVYSVGPNIKFYGQVIAYYTSLTVAKIKFSATVTNKRSIGNILDTTTWNYPAHGSCPGFPSNGGYYEQYRSMDHTLPDGSRGVTWRCMPGYNGESAGEADGGWNTDLFNIDRSKTYRFVVFAYRYGGTTGTTYLGVGSSAVRDLGGGAVNTNPYFWAGLPPVQNRWYMIAGYVYPSSYGGIAQPGNSGIWDCTTGEKVAIGTDYAWTSTVTETYHRAYLYYSAANIYQLLAWPRVEICDGDEPSLDELLASSMLSARNKITTSNASTYIESAAIGSAQIGSISVGPINTAVNAGRYSGGPSQGRVEIDALGGGRIRIYDASNNERVKIGYLLNT